MSAPVDMMKIDVEGAEGRVVIGAADTIARHRPIVVSEFSCEMLRTVSSMEPLAYLDFFHHLGYQLMVIDRSAPGQLGPVVSPTALLDDWGSDLRIEDLLFLPARSPGTGW